MQFEKIEFNEKEKIKALSVFATEIVREHFDPLIGKEQNDYMLKLFQSVEAITEQINHGYQYYFVNDGENRVGFLAFYFRENELYLSKFYVHKKYRGNGYSRKMLQFIIEQAKSSGKDSIVLNVNRDNPAVQTYEHFGFVKIREEKNDIGNGFIMDDFVMELKV